MEKIKATAAALDMCKDHGIDPATVPCPAGAELTQPMVQSYRDALASVVVRPATEAEEAEEAALAAAEAALEAAETAHAEAAPGLKLMPKPAKGKKK